MCFAATTSVEKYFYIDSARKSTTFLYSYLITTITFVLIFTRTNILEKIVQLVTHISLNEFFFHFFLLKW